MCVYIIYTVTGSDVYEVKPTEYLWQTSYDWTITSRVVIQFKERGSDQLVVTRHGEECLLW